MKKLKLYYLVGREWILEKWNGSAFDLFLLGCILIVVLTILSIGIGAL
jgi:hypothetical protein